MKSFFTNSAHEGHEPIAIGLKEAAALLSVGTTWLREKTIQGEVPHTKLGNRYKYNPQVLLEWFLGLLNGNA